ncbi:MAG: HIRAN domain-containing protein [Zoogloeaceae bacterium]|jgi:hypothetical protein|nr:HIRAN domain-containing protein [Zoogloeaceae bacterium]
MRLRQTLERSVIFALSCWFFPAAALGEETGVVRLMLQSSPLAGSQFHAWKTVKNSLRTGDALTLIREPENSFDSHAVRVEWRGFFLGYVPRRENRAIASALDRGLKLEARISRLRPEASDPWQRLEFEIWARFSRASESNANGP